ncbi:PilN domain-containing protein [Bradyrhizobium diazoefficiens]|uniref:PilN domain-containing protein n=1 Tax=Bradyrhizobium diazoefficiens TaxID=1355477 RepID=UPI00190C62EF|nr:PilN domain-containing protein [Bradyrhizobium diazoefficiens]MBK3665371.1 PilN domain-containing protein [Bradyrhizobium diazoefficiens]
MVGVSEIRPFDRETLSLGWRQFTHWWMAELREAVPPSWRPLLDRRARPTCFVSGTNDAVTCELVQDGRTVQQQFPAAAFGGPALLEWLDQVGLRRDQVLFGVVLAEDLFLRRDLNIPSEALASLPQILDQEVVRRTPFRLTDVWHAARPVANASRDGAVPHCHWIIARERATAAVAPMAIAMDEIDFLAVRTGADHLVSVVQIRPDAAAGMPEASRAIKSLWLTLLAAAALGLMIFEWYQAGVAAELEAELLEAKASVHEGKSQSSQRIRLYALKADSGFLAVWDELSRILPDDTFLIELRTNQGQITISGYSSHAAHLVRILDQSPMFAGATLIAAIVPDANEGKDRFSLKFRLRNSLLARPVDPVWKADQ